MEFQMNRISKFRIVCAAALGALLSVGMEPQANAATYNWSFVCGIGTAACSGNGTLTTAGLGLPITAFTGIFGVGSEAIDTLLPINAFGGNDNTLFSAVSPELSDGGIAFSVGLDTFRIFHSSGDKVELLGGFQIEPGVFSVVAVPLPAALPLFATVLAGGGLIAWRRKRKAAKIQTH
jgi:hypothetical protein